MSQQQGQPQPPQPQTQTQTQDIAPTGGLTIPNNLLAGLDPATVNNAINFIVNKFMPSAETSDMSMFNEKKLAQIGMRYLYLLLNQADNDLRKLEKVAGIKDTSPLHEVV